MMTFKKSILSLSILLLSYPAVTLAQNEGPNTVTISTGTAKLSGLLQAWALNDTAAAGNADFNFRMRRAEIKLSGSVTPETRWFVMFDAAKSIKTGAVSAANDNKVLQDLGVAFTLSPNFEITMGQFKIPTTTEGFASAAELLFPERSYLARFYGDQRQPGLMLTTTFEPVVVRLMASNGQVSNGAPVTNVDDTNSSKDVSGRVDYTIMPGLSAGVFGSNSVSNAADGHGTRWGANVHYNADKLLIKLDAVTADDWKIKRNGMVADFAYTLCEKLQAAVRYENFQTTTDPSKAGSDAYTVGLNYYLAKHNSKLQLAYSAFNNMNTTQGTYAPSADKDGSLMILNAQAAF